MLSNKKTFHHYKKIMDNGMKMKDCQLKMKDNQLTIMGNKKKKPCNNHYKRSNEKIYHHNWFAGPPGLLSHNKGIFPQNIFY